MTNTIETLSGDFEGETYRIEDWSFDFAHMSLFHVFYYLYG